MIGMTAPFSGPNGAYGMDMKMVIGAYFKQINDAGGINGRVNCWPWMTATRTERAVANTRALINEKKSSPCSPHMVPARQPPP
ncbi:MAG: ABC transporter substrate-binding protein [Propionivibrio sp.]|nr:ABC transporter substrate-binding protein [Propionivibrio sp.]